MKVWRIFLWGFGGGSCFWSLSVTVYGRTGLLGWGGEGHGIRTFLLCFAVLRLLMNFVEQCSGEKPGWVGF